jgi:DNA-binding NtrC family response regulator
MPVQTPAEYGRSSVSGPIAVAKDPPPTAKSAPRRVLVIDDEPLVRWAIGETLDPALYEIDEDGDVPSAIRLLSEGAVPRLVLLDLRLPDCSDLRLLDTIRRLAPAAIVILMTAFGSPDVRADALKRGAACVLDKPFELEQLAALVCQLTDAH